MLKASLSLPPPCLRQPALAAEEDPWEGVNRAVFRFNDTVDTYTLAFGQGLSEGDPEFVEDGIGNVFSNLGDVIVLTNDLLQGKVRDAGIDTSRILFNTTFGVLASSMWRPAWGCTRTTISARPWAPGGGQWAICGVAVAGPEHRARCDRPRARCLPRALSAHESRAYAQTTRGVDLVDTRASLLSAEKMIRGDRYIFVRNAYLQNREFRVKDGEVEDDFDIGRSCCGQCRSGAGVRTWKEWLCPGPDGHRRAG